MKDINNNLKICFPNRTDKHPSSQFILDLSFPDQTNQKYKQDLIYCVKHPELSCFDNYLNEESHRIFAITTYNKGKYNNSNPFKYVINQGEPSADFVSMTFAYNEVRAFAYNEGCTRLVHCIVHCKLMNNNIKNQEKTWSSRTYSQL